MDHLNVAIGVTLIGQGAAERLPDVPLSAARAGRSHP
jgi:hypothetical protein